MVPFPKSKSGNKYVIVLTDKYKKLTRDIPVTAVALTGVATVLVDDWVRSYSILTYPVINNEPQLVSKLFAAGFECLRVKHLTKTAYSP